MTAARTAAWLACAISLVGGVAAQAQTTPAGVKDGVRLAPLDYVGGMQPVMDNTIFTHGVLNQLEDRTNGGNQEFRYSGQAWSGTDYDKLWIKSEGLVDNRGRFTDGQHEFLYDRAVSTFFDVQAGVRVDLDSGVTRTWAALGVEGLSLYFFDLEATAYVSDRGRFAARVESFYDILLTNRLILQPQVELNFYSKSDVQPGVGSGLSDLDAGLRLRYEVSRKFAPYVGVTYLGTFGQARNYARAQGGVARDVRFTFGLRTWF